MADDLLHSAIDELYGADPDAFMARRTELVKQARADGGTAVAKQIGALRKPTRSSYAINMLARADPDALERLHELGEQWRDAEKTVDARQIRELTKARRRLIDELTSAAFAAAEETDPSPSVRDEVVSTLTAALSDESVADDIEHGVLVKPARWEGFGFGGPDLTLVPSAGAQDAERPLRTGHVGTGPQRSTADRPRLSTAQRRDARDARQRAEAERKAREEVEAARSERRPWPTPGGPRTRRRRISSWPPTRSRLSSTGCTSWSRAWRTPGAPSTRPAATCGARRSRSDELRTHCENWNAVRRSRRPDPGSRSAPRSPTDVSADRHALSAPCRWIQLLDPDKGVVMCNGCGGLTEPCTMLRRRVCLTTLSRNLEGELGRPDSERRPCRRPECLTLASVQSLVLKLADPEDCDELPDLAGSIEVRDLVHVFEGDGTRRGMHSGGFRWESGIGLIMGSLAGITNAGTHRPPAFGDCQKCWDPVMEGQFRGSVCRPRSPEFADCELFGAYRLRIEPSDEGLPGQGVRGTLEGLLIRPCR